MALREVKTKAGKFEISYEIINHNNKRDFILLHGWGSNKEIMKSAFKNILKDYRHIYIDMPGFGKSKNHTILRTNDYKDIINELLKLLNSTKDIIAGHSFGGKVATLLQPSLLVLLSSAGIPTKKPLGIKVKISVYKFFNSLGFGNLRRFFVSEDVKDMDENMYETFKNVVDESFKEIFKNYNKKTILFWGDQDSATPIESAKKINSLIKDSTLHILKGDHYFFIQHPKTIEKIITEEFYG